MPLWNPYSGLGAPLFANYQSAFLYPLNWPGAFLADYAALGWWMSVTAVLHLFIGGWGMWLFTGRRDIPAVGRGVSAIAYALTSYAVARLGTYPTISVMAWLPFLLWAVTGVMVRGQRRDVAWLALITGLVLTAGHAQTAWYGLLLAGLYALWQWGRLRGQAWRRLLWALGAVLLGAGVAGMQLLATGDLLANSQRADSYGQMDEALRYSYAPARLPNLVAPNIYGNPGNGSYIARGLFYEYAVYTGVLPLIGAAVAVAVWARRRQTDADRPAYLQDVPFWGVILLVGFLFALGNRTPVYPFLYQYVPTFDMFQAPGRWHLWTVMAISMLGGTGAAHWGGDRGAVNTARRTLAGVVAIVLIAMAAPLFLPADLLALEAVTVLRQELALTAVWVGLATGLTLLHPARGRLSAAWWAVLVWGVLAVDMGWATRGLNPTVPATFYRPVAAEQLTERGYWTQEALNATLYGQRVDDEGNLQMLEADDLGFEPWLSSLDYRTAQQDWRGFRGTNLPNMNMLDKRLLLNNLEPLLLADYAAWIEGLPEDDVALLAAVGRYGVDVVYQLDGPRAVDDPAPRIQTVNPIPRPAVRSEYDRMVVEPNGATRLLVRRFCTDGWRVTSDNADAFNCTETGFFSLQVPPRTEQVTLVYRPWWVWPGAALSLVSALAVAGLFITAGRGQPASAMSE